MPLQILRQDITKMEVDAIVNTTNRGMIGYSGVDLAVHKAAGPKLDEYCGQIAPIEKGVAVITDGYNLPAKKIIHTCGPLWENGQSHEKELLENCYISCLLCAIDNGLETIAFPLISSGAYGYPKNLVLSLAVKIITDFLLDHELTVYLCVYDKKSYELSRKLISEVESFIDDKYVSDNDEKLDFVYNSFEAPKCRNIKPLASVYNEGVTLNSDIDIKETEILGEMPKSLENLIVNMDKSFADMLFELIDKKGMTDVQCYKKANISRKTFSKIRCDKNYRPSKETVIAFSIALKLNLQETNAFLSTAGFTLSHSFKFDVIIEYFISKGNYDIFEINQTLFDFDQVCLGC